MITGTIKNQVHLQALDQKWQQKKQELFSPQKDKSEMTQQERMLADFQEQAEKIRKQNETADIYNKLKSGGTLTPDEISYLKEHDPEALSKYQEAQAEKKAYERQLKGCKTKEEVERLKLNRMGNFAAKAKSIVNDPYIPKSKKLELMNQLNNEVCVIRDAHHEFTKSRAYQELPTEEEVQEERAREAKAGQEQTQEGQEVTKPQGDKTVDGQDEIKPQGDKTVDGQDETKPQGETAIEGQEETKSQKEASIEGQSETRPQKEKVRETEAVPSFEKLSEEIEQYLIKNRGERSAFHITV